MRVTAFADGHVEERFRRAEAARAAGRWRDALGDYSALLLDRVAGGDEFGTGDCIVLEHTADIAGLTEQTDAAAHLLEAIALAATRRGQAYVSDYTTLKRIALFLGAGRLAAAYSGLESLQTRIGPLSEVPWDANHFSDWERRVVWPERTAPDRHLFFSRLYLAAGQYLAGAGQHAHATLLLERGLDHTGPPASPLARRAELPLRVARAQALFEHGRLDDCASAIIDIEPRIDAVTHPGWRVDWLGLAGQLALVNGRFGDAVVHLTKALDVCAGGGFASSALSARLNLARVYIHLNRLADAEEMLEGAAQLAEALGDQAAPARIACGRLLAHARTESPLAGPSVTEQWRAPSARREPAVDPGPDPADLPSSANFLELFGDRVLAVLWALHRGDLALAEDRYRSLHACFAEANSLLIRLRLHALGGLLAHAAGRYDHAADAFTEVEGPLAERGLVPELREAYRFHGWSKLRLADAASDPTDAARHRAEGLDLNRRVQELNDVLARSLNPAEAALWWLNKWSDAELYLAGELEKVRAARQACAAAPWWRKPWRWLRKQQALTAFLARLEAHRGNGTVRADHRDGGTPVPRPYWPRRAAGLQFLVLPDCTFVARLRRWSMDSVELPLTRLRLRDLVARLHQALADGDRDGANARLAELAAELHLDALVGGLPQGTERLFLIADDVLHGVPFAALPLQVGQLGERFALGCASLPRSSVAAAGGSGALILSVPDPVQRADGTFTEPLTEAAEEAAFVSEWYARRGVAVALEMGAAGGRLNVLARLRRVRYVHIACHGTFAADDPARTGLILAGLDGRPEVISLRDVAGLDLRGVRLVVLSSCWGADNYALPGRQVVSLAGEFVRVGVSVVLACLWPVDDRLGRLFAQRFYNHLDRLPPMDALRMTQADFRRGSMGDGSVGIDTSAPVFWGGYVLYGDVRALRCPV